MNPTAPQTTTITAEIATTYIEAARAAKMYLDTRNRAHMDSHTALFKEADARFEDLIAVDMASYNGPLRDLRHAVVNMEFNMAEARYSVIAK